MKDGRKGVVYGLSEFIMFIVVKKFEELFDLDFNLFGLGWVVVYCIV